MQRPTGHARDRNVNLTPNWAIPADAEKARTACMANPSNSNYTVDITHQQPMQWIEKHVTETGKDGAAPKQALLRV